ncbi:MAG: ribonuclease H-like YkuK family protein [Chitinophagales bacterium]
MKKHQPMLWRKFNGEKINMPIKKAVEQAIRYESNQGNKLKVCIGTDSQVRGKVTEFATVIVFLREKKGGFMFINNEKTTHKLTIKERMLDEVSRSVQTAYGLCDLLDAYDVDLEVHADINTNPNFQSNTALKEAMGYILGMGFAFKAKPEAFASSSCANKVV